MKKGTLKKWAMIVAAVAASAMLITGCGSSGDSGSGDSSTTETTAVSRVEGQGLSGGMTADEDAEIVQLPEITIGSNFASWQSWTPFRSVSGQRLYYLRWIYDRLAMVDNEGVYQPQAAKSWEVADDGVTWTVEIWDNIYDSAGNHITSSDVVWFIQEYMENGIKPCFGKVASTQVIDDYTLEIVMTENMADMFEVVMESTFIVSQAAYEADPEGFGQKPITSGPYIVEDFVPGTSCKFVKNENYWMADAGIQSDIYGSNIDVINVVGISEASQQQIALETGTVDAIINMDNTILNTFDGLEGYNFVLGPGNNGVMMMFSGDEHSVLADDLNLRLAICHAIDRNAIIAGAIDGYGELGYDMIPRVSGGFQEKWMEEDYFPYDPELAKEYLAQSNYDGSEISLLCGPTQQRLATIIQAQCQAVGINIKLDIIDNALYMTSWYDGRLYDLTFIATGNGGANIWSQMIDGDAYEHGDAMARKDQELTDLVHYVSLRENYTPENIDKVHRYVTDNAYVIELYLQYKGAVIKDSVPIVETIINNEGDVDVAASKYTAAQ